ncbi:DUF445 domain-containing protein [Sulfurimonas sediminis]|uniref:DUF445 domain-containing protein n=1 Tax=Sulfurimonas sediminis TaxID=2590020 RepID=A0A7M1B0B0_9BACT|nr:DUF445 domain-containing protein [Sulfurimonas sediminis]QOP43189.1 DUF445 domain-containing protein [Sulfurimonas sediminis]
MKLHKSLITNLTALSLVGISFIVPLYKEALLYAGLFALSGALTNQLAIHMLFEKVPFLYGSGVIVERFEAFKSAIKNLIMNEFFTKEQLEKFFANEEKKINLVPIIEETDFTPAFDALSKTVMESSFGGMLGMFGGENALSTLKEPFTNKLKSAVVKIVTSKAFNDTLQHHLSHSSLNDDMIQSIERVVDARLSELTPQMVKDIVQKMIHEHLDWLVVWGGVFGGFIGLLSSFIL